MKNFTLLFILLLGSIALAQETPKITLQDSTQLQLSSLQVETSITGNYAQTTYYMQFYNPHDRILEGDLSFPLGEGQSVYRFAMKVNGTMREAVIVEKELGRVAYESTIRQRIDPALLEKVDGNNYKARIYPIPAKGYKEVVLAYEQKLYTSNNNFVYELPLGIQETLKEFKVSIQVYGAQNPPIITNSQYGAMPFLKTQDCYQTTLTKNNFSPIAPIVLKLYAKENAKLASTHLGYFYIHETLEPKTRLKDKPKKVTLLWDASYSQQYRNLEKELHLLESYFSYLQDAEIQFVVFSNDIQMNKSFQLSNGNWESLKQQIKEVTYDGGTNFAALETLKTQGQETLLFTDGLVNLGGFTAFNNKPIYTINSNVSANHEYLKEVATKSGANYINLVRLSYPDAVKLLKNEAFQFLGIKNNSQVLETYPQRATTIENDFSLAGIYQKEGPIVLQFGYGGKVTEEIEVWLKHGSENPLVKRLWAKLKLQHLNEHKKENQKEIVALAKANNLITDFTSMIILDRVEDYVRYRIEPPEELKAAYKELLQDEVEMEADKKFEIEERKAIVKDLCSDLLEWYNQQFPKHKKTIKTTSREDNPPTGNLSNNNSSSVANNNQPETLQTVPIDPDTPYVSGTVYDENEAPLPGVNVIVKGTARGTQTDFDGNFSIQVTADELLEFSYIGYQSSARRAADINNQSLVMEPSNAQLEEVVVVGYARRSATVSASASVSIVQEESVNDNLEFDIGSLLSGKAAGIEITEGNGVTGASNTIVIRGLSSLDSTTNPLYVVDGVIVNEDAAVAISPNDIEDIQVLKGSNATNSFGARGSNGVIVIKTKSGLEQQSDLIAKMEEEINNKIVLKGWDPKTPYIDLLKKEPNTQKAYKKYLEIRSDYANVPTFYLDVADFFTQKSHTTYALRVLTNLIEIELGNEELLKALAYKLEYFHAYDLAVVVYQKILELRPENIQSYRDLALAYEAVGAYQKSFDLLYPIYQGELAEKDEEELYLGIEQIAYVELCHLVQKFGNKLSITKEEKEQFKEIPMDIRVVIDWNHNDTDIDLWVTDPGNEKTYYSNSLSHIGGRISEDMTDGMGPEEFILKDALSGLYRIEINYYGDRYQKISGPTILKTTIYTHYGTKEEQKKILISRLDKNDAELEVGTIAF